MKQIILGGLVIVVAGGAWYVWHLQNRVVSQKEASSQSVNTTQNPTPNGQAEVQEQGSVTPSNQGTYTQAEVAKHTSASDCWTIVNGTVYDLSSFVSKHPGGVENISKVCGIDGTALFEAQHGGQMRPEENLQSLQIGVLAQE